MTGNTEDFTFPIIITTTDNKILNQYFTLLPPSLWRFSSLSHQPDPSPELHPTGIITAEKRVLTKSDKNGSLGDGHSSSMADEEKMDGLWEGFNKEASVLLQEAGFGNNNDHRNSDFDGNNCSPSSGFCCSTQNDDDFEEEMSVDCGILCPKRKGKKVGLVGKMLKKLFLLQKPKF